MWIIVAIDKLNIEKRILYLQQIECLLYVLCEFVMQ